MIEAENNTNAPPILKCRFEIYNLQLLTCSFNNIVIYCRFSGFFTENIIQYSTHVLLWYC